MAATSALIVGCTGLVGAKILTLLQTQQTLQTYALSRRTLPTQSSNIHPIIASDTTSWPSSIAAITPPPTIFFSGLGTTRAKAGGLAQQRAIDYDLNLSLATAAQKSGARICVIISAGGANAKSMIPYSKMKGELDDAVAKLGFEKVIILRPGLLVGTRRAEDSRPAEAMSRYIAQGMKAVGGRWTTDSWAQDADDVAKAAVEAGLRAMKGEGVPEGKVWVVGQKEILSLARGAREVRG